MEISLEPRYEQMLASLVESGRFSSPSDAISAALEMLSLQDDEPLDEEILEKIRIGEEQLDRGEYVEYSLDDLDRLPDDIERRAKAKMAKRGTVRVR